MEVVKLGQRLLSIDSNKEYIFACFGYENNLAKNKFGVIELETGNFVGIIYPDRDNNGVSIKSFNDRFRSWHFVDKTTKKPLGQKKLTCEDILIDSEFRRQYRLIWVDGQVRVLLNNCVLTLPKWPEMPTIEEVEELVAQELEVQS